MAMASGNAGGVNSEINVTPMIDVLLVLLIIFMVVIALGRTAVPIQIPPTETAMSTQQSTNIVLEIRDDGTFWINGTQYSKADLGAGIKTIFDPRPVKLLFIKPGMNRIYSDVIAAIDVARNSGVEVIGVTPIEAN